ncbi:MAG TPA: hypothetical protein PLR47_06515, partial [Smithellaceae bacterium]|nr:hypothetical protein [Smithellaceae bacterium]
RARKAGHQSPPRVFRNAQWAGGIAALRDPAAEAKGQNEESKRRVNGSNASIPSSAAGEIDRLRRLAPQPFFGFLQIAEFL